MDEPIDLTPALPDLAFVRACGRGYAGTVRKVNAAHSMLTGALVVAYSRGATIAELSEASGLSRFAVGRAVKRIKR